MEDIQEFATKLFDFARNGDVTLLEYIAQGVNPNMVNQDGHSFVMLAAYNGHAELVTKLAAAGGDVNLLNDRNQSPLAESKALGWPACGSAPASLMPWILPVWSAAKI